MARGLITPGVITRDGLDRSTVASTTGDPTNGHYVPNRGMMMVEATNTNGAATVRHLTVHLLGGADGQSIEPREEPIPAGKTLSFGPYPAGIYGGKLLVDVDHAEVTLRAFELQT